MQSANRQTPPRRRTLNQSRCERFKAPLLTGLALVLGIIDVSLAGCSQSTDATQIDVTVSLPVCGGSCPLLAVPDASLTVSDASGHTIARGTTASDGTWQGKVNIDGDVVIAIVKTPWGSPKVSQNVTLSSNETTSVSLALPAISYTPMQ